MGVYFDHNATTPVREEALEALVAAARVTGNPNSVHRAGSEARLIIERARRRLAGALNADPATLVYTSGGTEANNLALRGVHAAANRAGRRGAIAVGAAEHKAILEVAEDIARTSGCVCVRIPVDRWGRLDRPALRSVLEHRPLLVSAIALNNETGTIENVAEVARTVHESPGVLLHTDASQAIGRMPVDLASWDVDLATFSGHKCGAPPGIGVLYRREGVSLDAEIVGGGQQGGLRSGTESAPLIAAFTEAACLAVGEWEAETKRLGRVRERLWEGLRETTTSAVLHTPMEDSAANCLCFSLPGHDSQQVVRRLDEAGVAVSAGAACSSNGTVFSHVILACTCAESLAASSIRVSMGRTTTARDVEEFLAALRQVLSSGSHASID